MCLYDGANDLQESSSTLSVKAFLTNNEAKCLKIQSAINWLIRLHREYHSNYIFNSLPVVSPEQKLGNSVVCDHFHQCVSMYNCSVRRGQGETTLCVLCAFASEIIHPDEAKDNVSLKLLH